MAISFELAGHVVGIMIDKDVDEEYMNNIHELIESKLAEHAKINLFCEVMPNNDVPFKIMFENIKFKHQHSDQISKLAVVTDSKWMRGVMDVDSFFISTQVKCFELKDRLEAIQWISE